jgi:hypothetical protein
MGAATPAPLLPFSTSTANATLPLPADEPGVGGWRVAGPILGGSRLAVDRASWDGGDDAGSCSIGDNQAHQSSKLTGRLGVQRFWCSVGSGNRRSAHQRRLDVAPASHRGCHDRQGCRRSRWTGLAESGGGPFHLGGGYWHRASERPVHPEVLVPRRPDPSAVAAVRTSEPPILVESPTKAVLHELAKSTENGTVPKVSCS